MSKFKNGATVIVTGGNYPITTVGSIGTALYTDDYENVVVNFDESIGDWGIPEKHLELFGYDACSNSLPTYPPATPLPVEPEHVQEPDKQEPDKHAQRKGQPIFSGCLKYFPDALLAIGECSRIANEQHNAGEPMHWSREKSADHPDALLRHLIDAGTMDDDNILHSTKVAWRALAMLQLELENSKQV